MIQSRMPTMGSFAAPFKVVGLIAIFLMGLFAFMNVPGLQVLVVNLAEKYVPTAVNVASALNIAAFEADLTFHQLSPETGAKQSGQEGAGIMVRDVNGAARQDPMVEGFEEVTAASNMFAVGLMRDGMSALSRTGVEEPWGSTGSA